MQLRTVFEGATTAGNTYDSVHATYVRHVAIKKKSSTLCIISARRQQVACHGRMEDMCTVGAPRIMVQ